MKITKFYTACLWILSVVFALSFSGCNNCKAKEVSSLTDYSVASNWFKNSEGDAAKQVDVFFLYPTTYTGSEPSCAVDNEEMKGKAPIIYDMQASAYEESCNVYMPFYRQLNASVILTVPYEERFKLVSEIPGQDCIAAFEYYMKHYNNGKPFVLAGHSQGSAVLLCVMEYLKDRPEYLKSMVASYVIGYSVTQSYFNKNKQLKFAKGADDTGVILSWNTEAPVIAEPNNLVGAGAISINPIIWTTQQLGASASENLGSRIRNEKNEYHKVMNYADAQVNTERGSVICSTVDPNKYANPLFTFGAMHMGDYELYYYNIQENVKRRIEAYISKK